MEIISPQWNSMFQGTEKETLEVKENYEVQPCECGGGMGMSRDVGSSHVNKNLCATLRALNVDLKATEG